MRNFFVSGFRLQASRFIYKPVACSLQPAATRYILFIFAFYLLVFSPVFAEEITILYTGETHAMLYPCNCPKEPDGGIARRATLIKQLKNGNPDILVLDSGGFFAGGLLDEYTQNTPLDMRRSLVNLKAMELMEYDAITIGDDEFNFGSNFLLENINKANLTFLSCNIKSDPQRSNLNLNTKVLPYIIKELAGTKIGIIGVTNLASMQKATDFKFIEPELAVKQAIEEVKKKKAGIVILLSHLGESEDLRLIKEVEGIDILVVGHSRSKENAYSNIGSTLLLRPSWQGRRLDKLSLTVENDKIKNYKVEELRLSDKISDDPDVLSILPRCFSDNNCKKEAMIGACQEPGTLQSKCKFTEASKISLLIITSKLCRVCDTESVIGFLKTRFPGSVVSYLYYPDAEVAKLVNDLGIKALPVYLLGKEVEKERGFDNLKENLELKGNFYMLKPQFSGVSFFLDRKKMKGKLDWFISLYDKNTQPLLDIIKEFNPTVHFLATEQEGKFNASKGNLEVEEYLRSVCVQKYYPAYFWDYISCRAKSIDSSWWEDCLGKLETNKIKICARAQEGKELLKENIGLNRELRIMLGPSYLLDNQEIFGLEGVPTKEEFEKIIKR